MTETMQKIPTTTRTKQSHGSKPQVQYGMRGHLNATRQYSKKARLGLAHPHRLTWKYLHNNSPISRQCGIQTILSNHRCNLLNYGCFSWNSGHHQNHLVPDDESTYFGLLLARKQGLEQGDPRPGPSGFLLPLAVFRNRPQRFEQIPPPWFDLALVQV